MIHYAAWPNWMVFVIIMAMVGPMLRFMFGGRPYRGAWGRRLRKQDAEDVVRLDEAIAERDTVIEDLQRRLSEMESRLDFTERLLAERGTERKESSTVNR